MISIDFLRDWRLAFNVPRSFYPDLTAIYTEPDTSSFEMERTRAIDLTLATDNFGIWVDPLGEGRLKTFFIWHGIKFRSNFDWFLWKTREKNWKV